MRNSLALSNPTHAVEGRDGRVDDRGHAERCRHAWSNAGDSRREEGCHGRHSDREQDRRGGPPLCALELDRPRSRVPRRPVGRFHRRSRRLASQTGGGWRAQHAELARLRAQHAGHGRRRRRPTLWLGIQHRLKARFTAHAVCEQSTEHLGEHSASAALHRHYQQLMRVACILSVSPKLGLQRQAPARIACLDCRAGRREASGAYRPRQALVHGSSTQHAPPRCRLSASCKISSACARDRSHHTT